MDKRENKKLYGREELKKYFRNGEIPSETHYKYLIDSFINRQDDGFSKEEDSGFIISPIGTSKRLMTFYKNMGGSEPLFFIEKDSQDSPSLRFQPSMANSDQHGEENGSFFFHQDGKMGLGKRSDEKCKLDVNGFVGMHGRIGTYKSGSVLADGKWHPILEGLDNCQGFEIVARTGKKGSGKFSVLHATALSAYGHSHSKIKKTCAYYGFFWNKLNLRWRGTTHNYNLELRTNRNYGKGIPIHYNISKLWDDELFLDTEQLHQPKSPNQ